MPHHESGLLGLRTRDVKVLQQAIEHFLRLEPHHDVQLVRVGGGQAVIVCFGSVLRPESDDHVDMDAFQDDKALAKLAKQLGQPLWVGFAVGGYTNSQVAQCFGPGGKRLWKSEWDFTLATSPEANDPFTSPERRYELIQQVRSENGYGRIGAELGFDYFRILDVEAGDPLFAEDKRRWEPAKLKVLERWLSSKFKAPEGEPGDGAAPPAPADAVLFRLLPEPGREAVAQKALAVVATLCSQRGVDAKAIEASVADGKDSTWLRLQGKPVRALSTTLVSSGFLQVLGNHARSDLFAYGWEGKQAPTGRAGTSFGIDVVRFMRAQREAPPMKSLRFSAAAISASRADTKQVQQLRRSVAEGDES